MGYTKIWTVSTRLDNSLNYITNPEKTKFKLDMEAVEGVERYIENKDKTENTLYVKAFNCGKDRACERMLSTQLKKGKLQRKDGILAYHLVQSFKDFETTPEVAYQCGIELVQRLFADRFEVVVATHIDKDHLHNHIIFNAVSFKDGYKYRNQFRDYFGDIRGISDQICREHCLCVINPQHRGMSYIEWLKEKEGNSIRQYVREEIDEIIKSSYTMNEFWKLLEMRGFQITRRGSQYKYTSFIPPNGTKRIRLDKLGKHYTEEAIKERITATRNGIKMASPSELYNKGFDFGSTYSQANPIKLKGFVALYYHYLYLFGMVKKKKTPQRVSFYMRQELIKFERYKKQFEYLYKNEIETGTQLAEHKKSKEEKINDLVEERKRLYSSKTEENEQEIKSKAQEINYELKELRKDVRMCKAISLDSYKISQKQEEAQKLIQQAEMEMKANEHKRRGR